MAYEPIDIFSEEDTFRRGIIQALDSIDVGNQFTQDSLGSMLVTVNNLTSGALLGIKDSSGKKILPDAAGLIVFTDDGAINADSGGGNIMSLTITESEIDHGALGGLADDDHTGYLLADGTRGLSGAWDAGEYSINCDNLIIGHGAAGIDYTLTFDGESNDGVLTWMESEDYFVFADEVRVNDDLRVTGDLVLMSAANSQLLVGVSSSTASNKGYFYHSGGGCAVVIDAATGNNSVLNFLENAASKWYVAYRPGTSTFDIINSNTGHVVQSFSSGEITTFYNSVIIGAGGAGLNYYLKFNGQDSDGLILWDEDEDEFRISSDDGTNYFAVEADGTLRFEGTATVFQDVVTSLTSGKVPVSNAPTWAILQGNIYAYKFDINDYLNLDSTEIPHTYKEGSDIKLHCHIITAVADAGDRIVNYEIEYTIGDVSEVLSSATVISSGDYTIQGGTTIKTHLYISVGTITGTNYKMGAVIKYRVRRIANIGGSAPSVDPFVVMVGAHVECDTVGSRTETTK